MYLSHSNCFLTPTHSSWYHFLPFLLRCVCSHQVVQIANQNVSQKKKSHTFHRHWIRYRTFTCYHLLHWCFQRFCLHWTVSSTLAMPESLPNYDFWICDYYSLQLLLTSLCLFIVFFHYKDLRKTHCKILTSSK